MTTVRSQRPLSTCGREDRRGGTLGTIYLPLLPAPPPVDVWPGGPTRGHLGGDLPPPRACPAPCRRVAGRTDAGAHWGLSTTPTCLTYPLSTCGREDRHGGTLGAVYHPYLPALPPVDVWPGRPTRGHLRGGLLPLPACPAPCRRVVGRTDAGAP